MAKTLDILAGIGKGYMQAADNLYAITQARDKLKKDDEKWQLDKKQMKLDLEKMEYEASPEQRALADKLTQAQIKQAEAGREAKKGALNIAESKHRLELETFRRDAATELNTMRRYEPDMYARVTGTMGMAGAPGTGGAPPMESGLAGAKAPQIPGTPYEPRPGEEITYEVGGTKRKIVGKKEPSLTSEQTRKVENEKQKALFTLERGYYTDPKEGPYDLTNRAEAEEYIAREFDVDITDPDIQAALEQYKPMEDAIDEIGWFEKTFGAQKPPTKQKYGYTYEKREDGKWHRMD